MNSLEAVNQSDSQQELGYAGERGVDQHLVSGCVQESGMESSLAGEQRDSLKELLPP